MNRIHQTVTLLLAHRTPRLRFLLALPLVCLMLQTLQVSTASADGISETTGGVTHTWTNYTNAGGQEGQSIPTDTTVQVTCKLTGFAVADGNTWWYQIGSGPWNGNYYASADAFFNDGETSGSLHGTPFVDPNVPTCGSTSSPPPTTPPTAPPPAPSVQLAQGPVAPQGYRYAITLNSFPAESSVSVTCDDSVNPTGFYTFSLTTNSTGGAFTQSYCYSADGPNHWVVAGGITSNIASWSGPAPGSPSPTTTTTSTAPLQRTVLPTTTTSTTTTQAACQSFPGKYYADQGLISAALFARLSRRRRTTRRSRLAILLVFLVLRFIRYRACREWQSQALQLSRR